MVQVSSLRFEMIFKYTVLICGKIGSGKTSLINFLSNQFNLHIVSFGSMIKKKTSEKQIEPIRKNLQNLGYEMFTTLGAGKLVEEAINYSEVSNNYKIIFDGVRHEDVLSEIKKISNHLFLIYLNVNEDLRFSRFKIHNELPSLSPQEFQEIDNHPIELGIDKLKKYADFVIDSSQPFQKVCSLANDKINAFISN